MQEQERLDAVRRAEERRIRRLQHQEVSLIYNRPLSIIMCNTTISYTILIFEMQLPFSSSIRYS